MARFGNRQSRCAVYGLVVSLLVAFTLCASAADLRESQERIDNDNFDLPAPQSPGEPRRLWATWYHVLAVDAIADGFRLRNVAGESISPPISGRHWCLGALQGVLLVKEADGTKRTYTFEITVPADEIDCTDYFKHRALWTQAAGRSRFGVSRGPSERGPRIPFLRSSRTHHVAPSRHTSSTTKR